jgi:MHS family alpha-ketoglutarate permease-like MFS transporter
MLVWSGLMALLVVPMSKLIAPGASFGAVLLVFCFGLGVYAIFASIAPAIMSELFPTELRGLGIGAWYNLTVAVFGGTAPLVIQWLGGIGHSSWFFWYVAVGAVIAFVATLTLPETKGSVLR